MEKPQGGSHYTPENFVSRTQGTETLPAIAIATDSTFKELFFTAAQVLQVPENQTGFSVSDCLKIAQTALTASGFTLKAKSEINIAILKDAGLISLIKSGGGKRRGARFYAIKGEESVVEELITSD